MKQYKNTGVYLAKTSATQKLLDEGKDKEADKLFRETSQAFERQIPNKEDRDWLMMMSKRVSNVTLSV